MKKPAVMLAAALVLLPAFSLGATVNEFQGGLTEAMAGLSPPGLATAVNLTFPAECHMRKAALNVSSLEGDGSFPGSPACVTVSLDGTVLWAFSGAGFGALGNQTIFSDNATVKKMEFGPGGGTKQASIRLPKRAAVTEDSWNWTCAGNGSWLEKLNWSGSTSYENMGTSVASAGDLNGDGYDDIITGEPNYNSGGYQTGVARVYFGGAKINSTPDLNLTSSAYMDAYFGLSVAGAGDVNGDGYDDVIVGGWNAYVSNYGVGVALIFFGGKAMDAVPDVVLKGQAYYDRFGYSVAGAGDINGDGYDDVIVGAPYGDATWTDNGRAQLFLGGQSMDALPDYNLTGAASSDNLGFAVAGVGDLNGDGFDDFAAAAPYSDSPSRDCGQVSICFGAKILKGLTLLNISGEKSYDYFGQSVAGAGDVNGDGFDDLIAGAPEYQSSGKRLGAAYLFLGGKSMDAVADLTLEGEFDYDYFGRSVSGAGDLDGDGCADFIVGAPYFDTTYYECGKIYVYFGSAAPDGTVGLNFTGKASSDNFGNSVSGAGDVNADGHPDILAGAPYADGNGYDSGRTYLFAWLPGIPDPEMTVGNRLVWKKPSYVNGSFSTPGPGQAIAEYLATAILSGTDAYDNRYVDVPVVVRAAGPGNITLGNLSVRYDYETAVPDFGARLEEYRAAHPSQKGASGALTVALDVAASSGGRIRLSSLNLFYDDAPGLRKPIPQLALDEDSVNPEILDLHDYFQDDNDPVDMLRFALVCATNSSIVTVSILANRYLSADALTGDTNDNWTGTVEAVVSCADHWGSRRESNRFTIAVRNINDPPLITSTPPLSAVPGELYYYNLSAVDGDNDALFFGLPRAPAGMTVNRTTGQVLWVPRAGGEYGVTASVEDGQLATEQAFTISVPNRPPRITSPPPPNALVGVPLIYNLTASDDDNDTLVFRLMSPVEGMGLDGAGVLSWTPAAVGSYDVSISVSDGKSTVFQNFTLAVLQPNRPPRYTSEPVISATAELPYTCEVRTADDDGDPVTLALASWPAGMGLDPSGRLNWTPEAAGNFTVALTAADGRGGLARQEFVIKVAPARRPSVAVTFPATGQKVEGKIEITGSAARGTHPVERVEVRIDGGEWQTAEGGALWRLDLDAGKLKAGPHTVGVRAFDGKGYSEAASVGFEVEKAAVKSSEGQLPFMTMLIIIVVIIAAVGIAAALAMRRKGKPAQEPAAGRLEAGAAGAPVSVPPPVPPAEPGAPAAPPPIPPPVPLAAAMPPPKPPKPKPPEREFTP